MGPRTAIILAAGPGPAALLPLFGHTSPAMLPLNGRPTIHWSLHYLMQMGIKRVVLGVRADDERLRRFVTQSFASLLDVCFITPRADRGPGFTLSECFDAVPSDEPALVVLADTLFRLERPNFERSFVLTHPVDDAARWCLSRADGHGVVSELLDKPATNPGDLPALIGVYYFKDTRPARKALKQRAESGNGGIQLSVALAPYVAAGELVATRADQWSDCGNLDKLQAARRRILQEREFNSLEIDELRGTLTKRSRDVAKFINEINYYRLVPNDLNIFFPRLVSFSLRPENLHITLEYYTYATLSELWVFEEVEVAVWRRVFAGLHAIMGCFSAYSAQLSEKDCLEVYWTKTVERVEKFAKGSDADSALVRAENVRVNGKTLRGWPKLAGEVEKKARELAANAAGQIIHGDLCYANILYDRLTNLFKFIDPRGSFGAAGIYGDPRYDLAKLMHSVDGGYDFLIHEMFNISGSGNTVELERFFPPTRDEAIAALNETFSDRYVMRDVRFIEGLLFLSMCPLHRDHPRRQRAMFTIGLQILNEVLES
ncbi:MAG: sugar phosphate nucleotidyltransferase [Phycisphaerae bacterium]